MRKKEFLEKLRASLWAMPEADKQRSLDYYAEMIDDRMEDGLSEEEAVAAIGDLDEIVKQILGETPRPPATVTKEQKQQKRGLEPWMIVLLVLGSPLWIPLVASAVGTVFSVYVSLWSVVIALYAVAFALAVAALGCFVGSFFMIGRFAEVMVAWGAGLLCAGFAIGVFLLSNLAAKGLVALTKLCWKGVQNIFRRKGQKV